MISCAGGSAEEEDQLSKINSRARGLATQEEKLSTRIS
jgi:hypothetical protein